MDDLAKHLEMSKKSLYVVSKDKKISLGLMLQKLVIPTTLNTINYVDGLEEDAL